MMSSHTHLTTSLLKRYRQLRRSLRICIDGRSLDLSSVYAVSRHRDIRIAVHDDATAIMQRNASFFRQQIESGLTIYGVNTGYGGSADVRSNETRELQNSLIRHLNAGFGEKLPSKVVRGVMLIRANSLSIGFSGVRPCVVDQLIAMLNADIVPVVPKRGSVSASGDLMPTSYIAACMAGRPDAKVLVQGNITTAPAALADAGLTPQIFEAKEALAVINSSSVAASMAACVLFEANSAVLLTQAAVAMTTEVLNGNVESFHPTIQKCLPHPGQREAADNLRRLLSASRFAKHAPNISEKDRPGTLKQDRYALRTATQWLAPVLETLQESVRRVSIELNSANDNPLIDHEAGEILHGGNFQGTSVTVAMDQARQALQLCGKLLFAQMSEMVNVNLSGGLPPNLAGSDPNRDFGFKGADTAMASYAAELDSLAAPVTQHVLSAELHNQSVNSLALLSARRSQRALTLLHTMLANIVCCQLQAIDLRWLEARVECRLAAWFATLGVRRPPPPLWPWHMFVLSPAHAARELHAREPSCAGWTADRLADGLDGAMDGLLDSVHSGRCYDDVCLQLGEGKWCLLAYILRPFTYCIVKCIICYVSHCSAV